MLYFIPVSFVPLYPLDPFYPPKVKKSLKQVKESEATCDKTSLLLLEALAIFWMAYLYAAGLGQNKVNPLHHCPSKGSCTATISYSFN